MGRKIDYMAIKDKEAAAEAAEEVAGMVRDIKDIVSGGSGNSSDGVTVALKKALKDLSKKPAPQQIAAGAGAGWVTGYLTMKVGKMAAATVGGSLILLQIAHHKGYIKVDWNKMGRDSSTVADRVKDKLKMRSRSGFERFMDFASDNVFLAGGFTGGFFLGIASS